jgi:xanthine dehydrogenase YagR molybdenum-binding subunit
MGDNDNNKSSVGVATKRIDGPLKVSGKAMYSSDHKFPGMLYAVAVGATISNGNITKLDIKEAQTMPGVKAIYHNGNMPKLFRTSPPAEGADMSEGAFLQEHRPPFEDNTIRYYGQYVAAVVADTFEHAQAAADAIKVSYNEKKPNVDSKLSADSKIKTESQRGDAQKAFDEATIKFDQTYTTPAETHNVIELHASVATFDGQNFTLYETTQGVINHRNILAQMLGVERENVRVITKFLGSGFGGKIGAWPQSALAAGIARDQNKPIKIVISRKAAFHAAGHRPRTEQRIRLSATSDGKLTSLQHDYLNHAAVNDDYKENCGECTEYLYSCPNLKITSSMARRNVGCPAPMRGPGAVPGLFATESAMDELAHQLKIDPVQFRVINEPTMDEGLNIPFASRHLLDCYKLGAEKFGWDKRDARIGSMKKDGLILGWGTAGASWIAERAAAEALVEIRNDGSAKVSSGTQDIGTGSYTVFAQVLADKLGLPVEKIEVTIGDSALPVGPLSGGSMAAASIIPAVSEAADKAKRSVLTVASKTPGSKFLDVDAKELAWTNGMIHRSSESPAGGVPFQEVLSLANLKTVTGKGKSAATPRKKDKVSKHSYGVHFVEITWQPELARLRVSRVITVIDAGKMINPKTARNQIEGAVVMGIGMAMFEQTHYEPTRGAPINSNLADYIVAVNADIPPLDVHFLEMPNTDLNEYGARGVGEIGLAGIAAAIANAVHHATGIRVRNLPIRIEDLLEGEGV